MASSSKAPHPVLIETDKSYVSQKGLEKVLKSIRKHGMPQTASASGIKRARDKAMPDIWTEVELRCVNGSSFRVPVIHPVLYLEHLLRVSEAFRRFFLNKLSEQPSTEQKPWNIAIYCDEIQPGNSLKANNMRKLIAFYWSFQEFQAALGNEDLWFQFTCLRTSKTKDGRPKRSDLDICGGWSQLFKKACGKFFERPRSLAHGVVFSFGDGEHLGFWARIGAVVADEAALKNLWCFKGSSGAMPCYLCRNCSLHSLELAQSDRTGWLVSHCEPDFSRFALHTDETVLESARLLEERYGNVSRAAFGKIEYAVGLNYEPEGALWDPEFLGWTNGPISVSQFDWMHCYLVSGIFQSEVTLLMQSIKPLVSFADAHKFLMEFKFPKALSSRAVTGQSIFKKVEDSVKCSASEGLTIYPVLRFMLMALVPDGHSRSCDLAKASYYALSKVLDLLKLCIRKEPISAQELQEAIGLHARCRLNAYGQSEFPPKLHYAQHLPSFLPNILACFVHERKHKDLKKQATDLSNTSCNYERSCLQSTVLAQNLEDIQTLDDLCLHKPSPAPSAVAEHLRNHLQSSGVSGSLGASVDMWHELLLKPGMRCCAKDVVLVKHDGVEEIGEIWFHVKAGELLYSCWSAWTPLLEDNRFVITDEPSFVLSAEIERILVWRQNGDHTASVVP